MGRRNQNDLTIVGFQGAVPLFTNKKATNGKFGSLDGIFGHLGALRVSPEVTGG